jgi:hypothetical protein
MKEVIRLFLSRVLLRATLAVLLVSAAIPTTNICANPVRAYLEDDPGPLPPSQVVISEFMALNQNGLRDEDGERSDWIEIHNSGASEASLDGWYLTDTETNLTRWRFPSVIVPANGFLLVWASGKDRRSPGSPLHTNFRLGGTGEYLALLDSNTNIASEFAPMFPSQQPDISYGVDPLDPSLTGFFRTSTPGATNIVAEADAPPTPLLSVQSGVYTNDMLTLTISGAPGTTIRYTLDGSVPTNSSPVYNGPITISGNSVVKARAYGVIANQLPSRIAVGTYVLLDASVAEFSSNLPLLVIDSRSGIPQDVIAGFRAKGSLIIFSPVAGRTVLRSDPEFQGLAEFEIFGEDSAGFPKKPYKAVIKDEMGNDRKGSFLGLPADSDWKLLNPYSDKTLLNHFLAYELFEQMGHYQMARSFVEVFVHTGDGKLTASDYHGILVLSQKLEIKKGGVDLARLTPQSTNEPSISGGYIFKKDMDNVGDLNFATTGGPGFPGQGLKMHDPKPYELPGGINNPQVQWLQKYLNRMELALYTNTWLAQTGTNHYSNYLDVDSFVDQFMIVEFTKQIDGYRLNTFFQKDRNGKVKAGPIYDWELSFGNADYLDGGHFSNWYYSQLGASDYPWAKRLIVGNAGNVGIGDPDFCQKIADRWGEMRTNLLNPGRLLSRIDLLSLTLTEAAARDFAKFPRLGRYIWPNPSSPAFDVDYVRPPTYAGIIAEMKKWVQGRCLWMDAQFTPSPAFNHVPGLVSSGATVTLSGPPGANIYYTVDGRDPRAAGGTISPTAVLYNGPITINGAVTIVARTKTASGSWQNTWSPPSRGDFYTAVPGLRITELMYHPNASLAGNDSEQFEYIEVQNIGPTTIDVTGFTLGGGVQFTFPSQTLASGESALIVSDPVAFQSRYGTGLRLLGTYTGRLNDGGDRVVLTGKAGEPIHDFSYSTAWYPATDGIGFSLVVADPDAPSADWSSPIAWRPSAVFGGSPGVTDPNPVFQPAVLINELLANNGANSYAIELYNPNLDPIDIGGWFVTDDWQAPRKFIIAPARVVPAKGYLVLAAGDISANVGVTGSFTIPYVDGKLYLFASDLGALTGYGDRVVFGASYPGITQGRYVNGQGQSFFVHQGTNSLGTQNSGPLLGPVVISEVHYDPTHLVYGTNGLDNPGDEYLELENTGTVSLSLENWRLRGAIELDFPPATFLPVGGFLLAVGFNPSGNPGAATRFRQRFGLPSDQPLIGPWNGNLPNDGFPLELLRPDPETNGIFISVEEVDFSNQAPWPGAASATGLSLQRRDVHAFGNDPANWIAAGPAPARATLTQSPPEILGQPQNRSVLVGTDQAFDLQATGDDLRYQWRFMGEALAGATNGTLVITNFQLAQSGVYNVLVFNDGGGVLATNFIVTARILLQITGQPQSKFAAVQGSNTQFSVSAIGSGILAYQWFHDGVQIIGATLPTLTLTNLQVADSGSYTVQVRDDYDTAMSAVAQLVVYIKPTIIVQPLSVAVVEGQTAAFTVAINGTPPITFRWRGSTNNGPVFFLTNGVTLVNGLTNSTLLFPNMPFTTNVIRVTVIVTNLVGQAPVSSAALFTVLKDTDHDGLPDLWEAAHGFDTNNAADGIRDDDGDKMSNAAEYIAGTGYLDPASYLKSQILPGGPGRLQFLAVSNRTYTIQYSDRLDPATWLKLMDVPASAASHTQAVIDPNITTNRFYRLAIPIRP